MPRHTIERLLRGGPASMPPAGRCLAVGAVGAALQGATMGLIGGEPRLCLYVAIKVPLLLAVAAATCLPAFYAANAALGLRDDFARACRGLVAAQAALGIGLGALAPVTAFLSLSFTDPYARTLAIGAVFASATSAAQIVLRRHYAPLVAREPRHRLALRGWLLLFVFCAVQLAWILRPFLGTEGYAPEFLRATALQQNAYVVLFEHLRRLGR